MQPHDWLEKHKPSASADTHVLAAAAMWTIVGVCLAFFGAAWVLEGDSLVYRVLLVPVVLLGLLKSRFVLDKRAHKIIQRIRDRGNGKCLGGFVSVPTWCLIVSMMVIGRFVRGGMLHRDLVGLLYLAVGCALVTSSRHMWIDWRSSRTVR